MQQHLQAAQDPFFFSFQPVLPSLFHFHIFLLIFLYLLSVPSGSRPPYYLIFLHSNVDAVKAENKTHKTFMASLPPVATDSRSLPLWAFLERCIARQPLSSTTEKNNRQNILSIFSRVWTNSGLTIDCKHTPTLRKVIYHTKMIFLLSETRPCRRAT